MQGHNLSSLFYKYMCMVEYYTKRQCQKMLILYSSEFLQLILRNKGNWVHLWTTVLLGCIFVRVHLALCKCWCHLHESNLCCNVRACSLFVILFHTDTRVLVSGPSQKIVHVNKVLCYLYTGYCYCHKYIMNVVKLHAVTLCAGSGGLWFPMDSQ